MPKETKHRRGRRRPTTLDHTGRTRYNNAPVRRHFPAIVLLTAMVLLAVVLLRAHTFYTTKITWSRDVSRIVYRNCGSCHHAGGSSFSLMTYKEARPWAEAIKQQVLNRRMPPWNAVKGFGEFRDDRGLSQEDLEIIGEWVEGGAPEGNPIYMPQTPDFNGSTSAGSIRDSALLAVYGTTTIRHAVEVAGIGPLHVPETGMLQAIAIKPNGTIVPLLWFEESYPNWREVYYFREPLRFSAGTRIEVSPRTGRVLLHLR